MRIDCDFEGFPDSGKDSEAVVSAERFLDGLASANLGMEETSGQDVFSYSECSGLLSRDEVSSANS